MLHCISLEKVPCAGAAETFHFHLLPVGALLCFDIYEYILESNKHFCWLFTFSCTLFMCLLNVLKTISNTLVAASFPSVSAKQNKSVKLWTALKKKKKSKYQMSEVRI